jgi:hypothetical protein
MLLVQRPKLFREAKPEMSIFRARERLRQPRPKGTEVRVSQPGTKANK